MADQRITQLTALPKAGVSATDVLPIADISATETKKVTAKDLVAAGIDLVDAGEIDLSKLDQNSVTKIGTVAIESRAIVADKLAHNSSVILSVITPASNNFEGRGYFNTSTGNIQFFNGTAYQQVVMPTAGIGDLQITTGKLADGAVTTAKVTALGTAAYADSSVTTLKIADGAITAVKIAADSITASQIAPSAIGASELADNAVDTASIQALAVTEAKLADGVVTTNKLGDLAVTNAKIAASTITYGKLNLADGSVPGAKITSDSITNAQIGIGAVQTSKLGDSAVTTVKIADGAVTAVKIASDSITASQIAANAVGSSELADDAVDTGSIVNLAVTEGKIAAGAVTNAKLGDLSVTDGKIANATITYAKLNLSDNSVPGAKIANGSITSTQLASSAVGTAEIANGAVTTAKIADDAVTAAKLGPEAVDSSALGAGAVTNAKIGSAAVTYDKIQNVSATDRLLGRSSAGAGSIEEIPLTPAGRALLDDADATAQRATLGLGSLATQSGTFSGTHSGTTSGTNTGDQTITLTGDVTGSGTGSFAASISTAAVTETKIASNAVTTTKIADDNVTSAKLADNSAAIVAASVPAGSGAFVGQQWINTATAIEYTWDGTQWLRQASLGTISFTDSTPLTFAVSYPDAYSATVTATLDIQSANRIFAGPTTGSDAAPTFRAIVPADLPDATSVAKGIILPGSGLSISSGTLNHSNSTTAGTYTKVTVDAQGHVSAGTTLIASDVPALDTSKITTGTFATAMLANDSVTAAKLADYSTAQIGSSLPTPDFIGQLHLNPLERTVYMWDGNVWQPVGITAGTVIFAGTYDANTNQIASVTNEGSSLGLSVGNPLPAASTNNQNYFVIVSNAGTGTSPAPTVGLLPPDLVLSTGTAWVRIESSDAYIAQVATQVSFTPAGQISSTNVQAAIEEVSSECRNATNITSGTLAATVGGTGITTYVKGDLIAGSGTNTLAKLAVGTNGYVLKANSSTATGLQWAAYDALVTGGGTMTGNLGIGSAATIVFEGATDDTYETVLTVIDPTADNTISLPNSSGTIALTSDLDDGTF